MGGEANDYGWLAFGVADSFLCLRWALWVREAWGSGVEGCGRGGERTGVWEGVAK